MASLLWQRSSVRLLKAPRCALSLHSSARVVAAESPPAPYNTSRLVSQLSEAGVPTEQGDALISSLRDAINDSFTTLERDLVSHLSASKWQLARKTDFAALKSEMQLLEHNDFAVMKTAHERLMSDIDRVKVKLREEISRTQAGVRLDLNLEKGAWA